MHPETHHTIEPSSPLGLCETCEKRPAVELNILEEPICRVCKEASDEDAWVRRNEEAQ